MNAIYRVGQNPRLEVRADIIGLDVIAAEAAECIDPQVYWLDSILPGDTLDLLGACSIVINGVDPRTADGGASIEIVEGGE